MTFGALSQLQPEVFCLYDNAHVVWQRLLCVLASTNPQVRIRIGACVFYMCFMQRLQCGAGSDCRMHFHHLKQVDFCPQLCDTIALCLHYLSEDEVMWCCLCCFAALQSACASSYNTFPCSCCIECCYLQTYGVVSYLISQSGPKQRHYLSLSKKDSTRNVLTFGSLVKSHLRAVHSRMS